MKRSLHHGVLASAAALMLGAGLASCDDTPTNSTAAGVIRCVGVSPRGFPENYSSLREFYTEVGAMVSSGVLWNGPWRDDLQNGTDAGRVPSAAMSISRSGLLFDFTPVVIFGWRSGRTVFLNMPEDARNNWGNTAARDRFVEMLRRYAATSKPRFIFLGNENDYYYEYAPEDYGRWIEAYNAAYDAVKSVSPATKVGPVFNYEHLAGLGALNGRDVPHWGALGAHDLDRVDIVGLTVYPWMRYAHAADVPSGYLDPIVSRIGARPIAVTETGWPAENLGELNPPWETSPAAQVAYLGRLEQMLRGRRVSIVNWLNLNQMTDPGGSPLDWKLFGSVALRDTRGSQRPVYSRWMRFMQ